MSIFQEIPITVDILNFWFQVVKVYQHFWASHTERQKYNGFNLSNFTIAKSFCDQKYFATWKKDIIEMSFPQDVTILDWLDTDLTWGEDINIPAI